MPNTPSHQLDVAVVGSVHSRFVVWGKALPTPGHPEEGSAFRELPGGKGLHQAVAATRLGARTALLARLGADARGDALMRRAAEEGVDVHAVVRDVTADTGVALVMAQESGASLELIAPGANHRMRPSDVLGAAELLARAQVMVVQLEVPFEVVQAALRLGRAAGAKVVLDPAPATPLPEALLRDVHLICPNAAEAEVLTGHPVHNAHSAHRAATNLLRRGAGAALVSTHEGSLLLSSEVELWLPSLRVTGVDDAGADAALLGALAASLAEGKPLPAAATFAQAAASLATTRRGELPSLPHRHEVLEALDRAGPGYRALDF